MSIREILIEVLEEEEGKDTLYRIRDQKTQAIMADSITFDAVERELFTIEKADGAAPKIVLHERVLNTSGGGNGQEA
jgi:hypothetical protein